MDYLSDLGYIYWGKKCGPTINCHIMWFTKYDLIHLLCKVDNIVNKFETFSCTNYKVNDIINKFVYNTSIIHGCVHFSQCIIPIENNNQTSEYKALDPCIRIITKNHQCIMHEIITKNHRMAFSCDLKLLDKSPNCMWSFFGPKRIILGRERSWAHPRGKA